MKKVIDLTGQRFGQWTALYEVKIANYNRNRHYLCRCDCGTEKAIPVKTLRYGDSKSCGHALNLVGQRFGRLTVISLFSKGTHTKGRRWLCQCDCGNQKVLRQLSLRSKHIRSCGCLRKEVTRNRSVTHGKTKTTEYNTWAGMIRRCHAPNSAGYHKYGKRGIKVCKEWRNSFEQFFADMGNRPSSKYSIHRIDNDEGYSKNNCKWATIEEQANCKRTSRFVTFNGLTLTIAQWARKNGIKSSVLHHRIFKQKWPINKALSRSPKERELKLTKEQISQIKSLYPSSGLTQKEVAKKFSISQSMVCIIIHKKC